MAKRISFLLSSLLFLGNIQAQDPHFSQLYANRLYLNPALTGIESQPELHLQYRNQWPKLAGNFQTANLSYDQKIESINSGIGAILMYDQQGTAISEYSLGLNYAYHLEINEDVKFHFGTQFLYAQKQIDWTELTYGEMIDPRRGIIFQTGAQAYGDSRHYLDLSFGVAGEIKGFFFGGSIHHINQPDVSLTLDESRLPMRYSLHSGYNFRIKLGAQEFGAEERAEVLTLSPHVFYRYQNGFQMLTYGFYSNFKGVTFGAFSRQGADLVFILGYDFNALCLAYSYDYVTSQLLNQATGGSHEISLRYSFGADFKTRVAKPHSFPTF